jgi:hypothetical protein
VLPADQCHHIRIDFAGTASDLAAGFLTNLNATGFAPSILATVIAEQPKEGCSDTDGKPRPAQGIGAFFLSYVIFLLSRFDIERPWLRKGKIILLPHAQFAG